MGSIAIPVSATRIDRYFYIGMGIALATQQHYRFIDITRVFSSKCTEKIDKLMHRYIYITLALSLYFFLWPSFPPPSLPPLSHTRFLSISLFLSISPFFFIYLFLFLSPYPWLSFSLFISLFLNLSLVLCRSFSLSLCPLSLFVSLLLSLFFHTYIWIGFCPTIKYQRWCIGGTCIGIDIALTSKYRCIGITLDNFVFRCQSLPLRKTSPLSSVRVWANSAWSLY